MWLKLLKDVGSHKKDQRIEEADDGIARAWIAAGRAVEDTEVETDLTRSLSEALKAGLDGLAKQIDANNAAIARTIGGEFKRFNPQVGDVNSTGESEDDKLIRRGGFKTGAHYYMAIHRSGSTAPGSIYDDSQLGKFNSAVARSMGFSRAVSVPDGMAENTAPDGGALIPPDFSNKIWERVYSQEKPLSRCDGYTIAGNQFTMPASSETSRVNGQRWGGVQGYWEGEAQQLSNSRPKYRDLTARLKKLTILIYATDEMLQDAPVLEQRINKVAPQEMDFKITDAIINGTGAGIPQGLLRDPSLITVARDTGQASNTITYSNVINMYRQLFLGCRPTSCWFYNQEIEAQLDTMALPVGTGGIPVFVPDGSGLYGGAKPSPNFETRPMLKGRPMYPLEQCPGLGLSGALILADLSQMLAISKGSIQSAMSIHLKFDYAESVFRFIFRLDLQGTWAAPLTPYNTNLSLVYGCFVVMAAG
jgi:HK97 family phage major capsid protein